MEKNKIAKASASLWHYPLPGVTGGSGITAVDVIVVDLETADGVTGTGFSYVLGGSGTIVATMATDLIDRFVSGHVLSAPAALWRR